VDGQKIAFFVDDNPDFLDSVSGLVEHPQFKVQTYFVTNGYKIVDEIIKTRPAIVFIDFNLPRVNGGQVVSVLRSIKGFEDVPIYFMTGYPKETVKSFLKGLDFDGIVEKEVDFYQQTLNILEQSANASSN
jgi:CheY-like chemotaxis protein